MIYGIDSSRIYGMLKWPVSVYCDMLWTLIGKMKIMGKQGMKALFVILSSVYFTFSFNASAMPSDEFKRAASFVLLGGENKLLESVLGKNSVTWEECKVHIVHTLDQDDLGSRLFLYRDILSGGKIEITVHFNKINWKFRNYLRERGIYIETLGRPIRLILEGEDGLAYFNFKGNLNEEQKKRIAVAFTHNGMAIVDTRDGIKIGSNSKILLISNVPTDRINNALQDIASICPGSSTKIY